MKDCVVSLKGKKIEVTFDIPCALQIDGEVVDNVTTYTVEVPAK
jgi:diacylglycerol kinase family enzyme